LYLSFLEPFTYQVIRERVLAKCLCLIVGVEWREVDMLIYANIFESETHLVGLEIRINDQQS